MTLYSPAQPRDRPRVGERPETFRYPHDWTALGDRYIDRGHVRQRVAFAWPATASTPQCC